MLAKQDIMKHWQADWDVGETDRFAHSIISKVSNKAWFEGQRQERKFICNISRIISDHTATHSHLNRFQITDSPLCVCCEYYETVDHLIWDCPRFEQSLV
jgi:zinc-binding in reverse transcriptase